ncbi:MAG: hypothetical protein RR857_19760, partial [Comamonas sp.]
MAKIDPLLNTRLYTRQSKPFKQAACQLFFALVSLWRARAMPSPRAPFAISLHADEADAWCTHEKKPAGAGVCVVNGLRLGRWRHQHHAFHQPARRAAQA